MAVDLSELVPYIENKVNGPAGVLITAEEDAWVMTLANGFWSAKNNGGFFKGYREADGSIFWVGGGSGEDLAPELQQIVVAWSAFESVRSLLIGLPTMEKAGAGGGLETETQYSATLLVALLKDLSTELETMRINLLGTRYRSEVGVIDGVLARDMSIGSGASYIVRS